MIEVGEIYGSLSKVRTKNVIESRKNKVGEFLKACTRKVRKCLHCSAPVRLIRHEGQTKIFHRAMSSKNAETWSIVHLQELKRKRTAREMAGREGSGEELGDGECDGGERGEEGGNHDTSELAKYTKQNYLSPLEVRKHMRELWVKQRTLIRALVGCSGHTRKGGLGESLLPTVKRVISQDIGPDDIFFLEVIPVPPSRFRPVSSRLRGRVSW